MGNFIDIPGPKDVVGRLPSSNVYHILRKQINDDRMDLISICGNLEGDTIAKPKTEPEYSTLSEANSKNLRLCETCKANLKMYSGEKVNECVVCGRINLLTQDIFRDITIPKGSDEGEDVSICKPCRIEIVTINRPALSE